MKQKIKVIFFDAGGTLFRPYPSVGAVYAKTAAKHGVQVSAEEVEKAFYAHWHKRSGTALPVGRTSDQVEREWWYGLVRDVFGNLKSFTDFDLFFEELYDLFARAECWRLFDDSVPILERLSADGYRLAIISNWDRRLFSIVDQLGLKPHFEHVTASAVAGISKPGKGIFDQALAAMKITPAEALHVGDSLKDDYHGAKNAGLHAVLLDRAKRTYNEDVVKVESLLDLVPLLTEKNT